MKKILSLILAMSMVTMLAACSGGSGSESTPAPADGAESQAAEDAPPAEDAGDQADTTAPSAEAASFEGKIAVITNTVSQNEEEYMSAQHLVQTYGEDKIIHQTWPDNFMTEQEQMVSIVSKLASDPEIKALIINQAVPGTNAAVDKLLETRDDMFIIYCTPQENPPDVVERANLVMMPDEPAMGPAMVKQAAAMGAKTFVHYSFPRHMSQVLLSTRRELIKQTCEEMGIEFVDLTAPDPTGDSGLTGAQQFILEDVPKVVAEYGADTAFFSTNCSMQIPLIKKVVDEKAIYPQPCCPSPFHGFPTALGIETSENLGDMQHVIDETNRIVKENGVEGRLSTWPAPAAMMNTVVGAEYAIKWINGEVPKDEIDVELLTQMSNDYANGSVIYSAYEENGTTYPTFLMEMMDYLTYNG